MVGAAILGVAAYFLFFSGPSQKDHEQTAELFTGFFCQTDALETAPSMLELMQNLGAAAKTVEKFYRYVAQKGADERQIQALTKVASQGEKKLEGFAVSLAAKASATCPEKVKAIETVSFHTGLVLGIIRRFSSDGLAKKIKEYG